MENLFDVKSKNLGTLAVHAKCSYCDKRSLQTHNPSSQRPKGPLTIQEQTTIIRNNCETKEEIIKKQ